MDEDNSWEESSSDSDGSDASAREAALSNDSEDEEEVKVDDHSSNDIGDESSSDMDENGDPDDNSEGLSGRSRSSSNNDDMGDVSSPDKLKRNQRGFTKDEKKLLEENPDIYGIRRSVRIRKEPLRFNPKLHYESDSDASSHQKDRRQSTDYIPTLSESDSGSDSSYGAGPKSRRIVPKSRGQQRKALPKSRQRDASTSSSDFGKPKKRKAHHPERSTSRGAGKEISYKEDSEEETDSDDLIENDESNAASAPHEEVETIEKVMRHRYGRLGVTGAQTTVYAKEKEELDKLGDPDPKAEELELQFFIKWKNWSHLHNTWESRKTLEAQHVAGMKKLENYIKRLEDIDRWKKQASPEDVEYYECQQEMNDELQYQYQTIERIIAHRPNTDAASKYPDYLCKWTGLPYSESSWEDGELVTRFGQQHIDAYLERERSSTIPNKNAKCLRCRPKFVSLKSQPKWIGEGGDGLELRDYQLDGINWLLHSWSKELSSILADEMGLGKTIQTISFLSCLFHLHDLYGPFLIVVPLSTIDAWQREFQLWAPDINVIVYIGDVNSRTRIQEFEWCLKNRKLKFNVVLTTYEMLLRDKDVLGPIHWAVLVVDEAHRLKNEDSLLYRILVDFHSNYRLLITGTPLQNSLKELWTLLHFLMPEKFYSWAEFEVQFSLSEKEGYQKLHRELEPFLLRRDKKNVEKSLPSKVEQILRVEMSHIQKQYYKLILTKNVKELCKELKGSFTGLLNIVVELKKCCNHASLIAPLDPAAEVNLLQTLIRGSGKMILLDKLLSRLKDKGHRVLIFSQMVRMLDIIADYMTLKRFQYQRLDGSIRGDIRKRALDHFNAEGSQDFCFLLSTRAGGLGINLASADTVIIFDSDWNPQNDLQAMARAHRIGQKNQVNIYRFVTKSSIEEDIIERAKKKMVLDHLVIQRMDTTGRRILAKSSSAPSTNAPFNKEELSQILKFGAEDLFKDHEESDAKLQAMDIDDILMRAEKQDHHDDSHTMGEELLSQFRVVNYSAFEEDDVDMKPPVQVPAPANAAIAKLWEDIIPEDERRRAELEEEEKKKQETNLPPRQRKTVKKMNVGQNEDVRLRNSKSDAKFKSKEFVDDSDDVSSLEDEDDDMDASDDAKGEKGRKKRKQHSRSKVDRADSVPGFSNSEIRRFVKSYKKFPRPLTRLDSIAEDAELSHKSPSELERMATVLHTACEAAVKEYEEKLQQDEQFDGKKKGVTIKISSVTVNAHAVLKCEEELEELANCIPVELKAQRSYRLTAPTRNVHWGKPWSAVEDSMLLVGILNHGVGNWDAIKHDPSLGLTDKILPAGGGKPQEQHLQSRADYLLKLLKESAGEQHGPETLKKPAKGHRKKRDKTFADVGVVEPGLPTKAVDFSKKKGAHGPGVRAKHEKKTAVDKHSKIVEEGTIGTSLPADLISDESLPAAKVPARAVVVENVDKMDEQTFQQCKDKMRPVKAALRLLHTPDTELSEKEQVNTTKQCLLKIGDHIEKCLEDFHDDSNLAGSWRSNLWSFVAKFTEFAPSKLYKLYRTAHRKRDSQREEKEKEIQKLKASYSSSLHEIGKQSRPDRLELEKARKRALGLDVSSPASKIPKLKMKIPHKEERKEKRASTLEQGRQFDHGSHDTLNRPRPDYSNDAYDHEHPDFHPGDRPRHGFSKDKSVFGSNDQHRSVEHHRPQRGHGHAGRGRRNRWPSDEKPGRAESSFQPPHLYEEKPPDASYDYRVRYNSYNRRPRYDHDRPAGVESSGSTASFTSYDYHHSLQSPSSHGAASDGSCDAWAHARTSSGNNFGSEYSEQRPRAPYVPYGSSFSGRSEPASKPGDYTASGASVVAREGL